jgi:L-ascorbate metabolism protein UlaG (beta-lactamase superfamily)
MKLCAIIAVVYLGSAIFAAETPATKNLAIEKTSGGELGIQPINHSALRFEFKGKQYYVDPAGKADWQQMPKADVILITHQHGDHLSQDVIRTIRKPETIIMMNEASVKAAGFGDVINVGETKKVLDISVEAVPAYNLDPARAKFHPKERKDNGYVLTFADKRLYVAGDTEGTPEMKALKNIDIAFIPINLPYTMTPQAAVEAVKAFRPKILYPYHQGRSDPNEVKKALADEKGIEVRVLALEFVQPGSFGDAHPGQIPSQGQALELEVLDPEGRINNQLFEHAVEGRLLFVRAEKLHPHGEPGGGINLQAESVEVIEGIGVFTAPDGKDEPVAVFPAFTL